MRVSSLLIAALTLVSCSKSGVDPVASTTNDSATFLASPVVGVAQDGQVDATFSSIATSRLMNFTACLRDVAVQEPVVGANFTVSDGSKTFKLKSPTTDSSGCLYWSENFSYNSTDQETYFEVERFIEATSIHKGRVSVKLAVNPWSKGGDAVKDLRFTTAPTQVAGANNQSRIVIETVGADMEIMQSQDAVADASLRLTFSPKLSRVNLDGSRSIESLTDGKFKLRTQIIALNGGDEIPLTNVAEFGEAAIESGVVQKEAKIKILHKIPREATIELSFEAIPLNGPAALQTVQGRIALGRFTSLSLSTSKPLKLTPKIAFAQGLSPAPGAYANQEPFFGFELGRVHADKVTVGSLDHTGKPNLLLVDFSVCVRNSISQEKILDQKFSAVLDGKKFPGLSTSKEDGCLRWRGQPFKFDYHAKEINLERKVTIQSENSFYGQTKVERTVYLDLWNFLEPGNLVADAEYDGAPVASVADTGVGSEVLIDTAFFNFVSRTFQIDSHLNLSTIRTYRFQMTPKIRRLSRTKGWQQEGTGNGRYMVRLLLETIDNDHPKVIDAKTLTIVSAGDTITSTVDFRIDDLRYVNLRTNMSVEIIPLDRNSSITTRPFMGTFDMLSGFAVRLEPRKGRIDSRMSINAHLNPALRKTGAEIFRDSRKPIFLDSDKLMSLGTHQGELDLAIAAQDVKALGKLCAQFYDKDGWFSGYKSCVNSPRDYLTVVPVNFVRDVQKSRLARQPDSSDLGMSASVNYSMSESEDHSFSSSKSLDHSTKVGVSVPLISALGIDIGTGFGMSEGWSWSHGYSEGKSHGQGRSGDQAKKITVDQIEFAVTGHIDRCILVTNKSDSKPAKSMMGCHSNPLAKTFTEDYYFMYQGFSASGLLDVGAQLEERPLLSLIRGTDRFEAFKKLLQDPTVTLNLSKTLPVPAEVLREADNRYDGYFPGLLTQ